MDTAAVYEVLILEDHEMYRPAFCALLEKSMKTVNIHEASNYKEAINILSSVKIDFAFLDIALNHPGADHKTGIDVLKYIRTREMNIRAIMLSSDKTQETIDKCLDAGASGYIIKAKDAPNAKDVMKDALLSVLDNKVFVPYPGISGRVAPPAGTLHLTPKEKEFLYYICQGDHPKVIARKMDVEISTTKDYASRLHKKFNVHTRSKLMVMAARLGLQLPNPGLGDRHQDG